MIAFFFLSSYSQALFSQDVDQKGTAIEVLQFNNSEEKQLFEAYAKGEKLSLAHFYLASDNGSTVEHPQELLSAWTKFSNKLSKRKKDRNSERVLEQAFYKTHRRFLKEYRNHSSLQKLFKSGTYDCLSGTSLYVLLLEEMGYNYEIRETDYHIYLLVNSGEENSNEQFLLESTDAVSGFVSGAEEILKRRKLMMTVPEGDQSLAQGISSADQEYQFSNKVNNSVNAYELAGLHYYNQGINSYNNHLYLESIRSLQKALFLYKSPRIEEFLALTVSVALTSEELNENEKQLVKTLHEKWSRLYAQQMRKMAQNN